MIPFRLVTAIVLLTLASAGLAPAKAADDKPSVAQQILGEWEIYRTTADGKIKVVKEHRGDHTIISTYDPNGNLVYSRRSDYKIDSTGEVNIFRFSNSTILVGPNAGAKDPSEFAYLFRVEGDRFLEVTGMMADDTDEPGLKVWRRPTDGEEGE